jgi:hypothetical protein
MPAVSSPLGITNGAAGFSSAQKNFLKKRESPFFPFLLALMKKRGAKW